MKKNILKYAYVYRATLIKIGVILVGLGIIFGVLAVYQHFFTLPIRTYGGSYREGIIGTARFINPVLAQSNADKDLTELTFGSLIDVDRNGNISYRIAEKVEASADQKTYIVTLNPEAHFSDGNPITSSDVIFTIDKIKSPLIKSPLYSRWAGVEVVASGTYELTFTLSQPYTDFIYNLTIGVLPRHIWENTSDEEFAFSTYNTNPVSSGWFKIDNVIYEKDGSPRSFTLSPNRHTFDRAYLRSIEITRYEDADELKDAYLSGAIDGAYGISSSKLEEVNSKAIHSGTLPRVFGLFFNVQNNKETINANARTAINYAINREGITNEVFGGYASVTNNPWGAVSESNYNPEKAREILAQDNWKLNEQNVLVKAINGKEVPLSFTITVPNIEEIVEAAEFVKVDLEKIGVIANIRSYDETSLTNEIIRNRDYDAVLFGYVLEKPSDIFAFWHSSQVNDPGLNISVYNNPRVDAAVSNIRNQQERQDDQANFSALWERDMPAVFLYSPEYLYLVRENFEVPDNLTNASERFNQVNRWYLRTKHIWKFLVKDSDSSDLTNEDEAEQIPATSN
jgi:peptide/nickel transport system substrate-binding protein